MSEPLIDMGLLLGDFYRSLEASEVLEGLNRVV